MSAAARIVGPAGIFAPREAEMRRHTEALTPASGASARAGLARQLQSVAEALLGYAGQRLGNVNDRLCQHVSRLRENAAGLIRRAARLAS
ncbi:hypothetical protein [Ancylobacter sp. FA202]|uniref:hypothetical protein n=1 Tax=Ancylobacter sp. FA202 TaxID=1111106 RepID=UPI0003712170|nr:hypothetical protein [Ancylobacter sp. FA202]